ncbi:MAG: hypothetical protein KF773_00665 [Deltaproteobacteria bacterium]|nr:hypothetical protein [Deltaproteobacteria bacterium]MCW5803641.1 hypothetical protein [Deltaproteobacteria bacterium]
MSRPAWVIAVAAVAACTPEKPQPQPPKAPNTELIVGEYAQRKPAGEKAMRFETGGTMRLAKTRTELDRSPHLADGTWKLDGDQLTLTYTRGACSEKPAEQTGTYKVVLSRIGVRFTKVEDACEARASLDGQTWWRQ